MAFNFGSRNVEKTDFVEKHLTSMIGRANRLSGLEKDEVLQYFEEEARGLRKQITSYKQTLAFTTGAEKHDRVEGSIPLHCLRPVLLRDMSVNKTHRGLYIKLKVISSVKVMTAVEVMAEDENGDFTFLAMYQVVPSEDSLLKKYKEAEKRFLIGTYISVKEPFLKVRQDGTVGIRVDSPKDLVLGRDLIMPTTYQEWKSEGNKLFQQKLNDGALNCYSNALKCLILEDRLIFLTLLNVSLCSFKLKEYRESLLYAFAASVIGKIADVDDDKRLLCKAYLRFYESALALKENILAEWSIEKVKIVDENFWRRELQTKGKCSNKHTTQELTNGCMENLLDVVTGVVCSSVEFASSEVVDTDIDSKTAKENGGLLYNKQDYQSARRLYLAAIQSSELKDSYADVLRNLSLCSTSDDPYHCSSVLLASICINPLSEKSVYRLSCSFLQFKLSASAMSLCQVGLSVFSTSAAYTHALLQLREKIEVVQSSGAKQSKIKYPKDYEKQVMVGVYGEAEYSTLEEMKSLNALQSLLPLLGEPRAGSDSLVESMKLFQPVPFHFEYKTASCLPFQCDPELCYQKLEEGFELARSYKFHTISLTEGLDDDKPETILRRFGPISLHGDFESWRSSAVPGSYWHSVPRKYQGVYIPSLLQAFSNAVYKPGVVQTGTCQVSIGFVDLNSLIYNDLEVSEGCFRWIGYEMSAYSVAKTLILADLMKTAQPEAVLQVWYSSAWSRITEKAFLNSVTSVLSRARDRHEDEDVIFFLSHWLVNKVSLKQARKLWLDSHTESCMGIASFTRDSDRKALCSYLLSGQLLDGDIGSTVMFCNPPGYGDLALNLHFLQTIYYPLLTDKWRSSKLDVISVGISIVLNKILTWCQYVKSEIVSIDVKRKEVKLDRALTSEIASFQPSLVCWSNVSDYTHPSTFFQIVRAISSPSTTHQFYSMNWLQYCFGTFAMDYPKTQRQDLVNKGEALVRLAIVSHKVQHLLISSDIVTNAVNTSCALLATRFYHQWLMSFIKTGGLSESQIVYVEIQDYNMFHRGTGNVYASITMKPAAPSAAANVDVAK